ncbi:MAG: hypothetical protein HZA54_11655 [Planctomycetes bacterium]|nr:hypothetical protein [Planctomycetota bacterium]
MASPGALDIYWNLVTAAHAEDGISPAEERALRAQAERLGLARAEADEIHREVTTAPRLQLKIPQDAGRRWQALCALLDVAAADGTLAPKEVALAQGLARAAGIPPTRLPALLQAALQASPGTRRRAYEKVRPGAAAPARVAPSPPQEPAVEPLAHPPVWPAAPSPIDFLEIDAPSETLVWPESPAPTSHAAAPGERAPRAAQARPSRAEVLRPVPVLNRLAPTLRACTRCGMSFGDRNAFARVCPTCRDNRISASSAAFLPFWIGGAVIAALLLQTGFHFYSWWWDEAILAAWQYFLHPKRTSSRRGRGEILVLLLAFAVPLALTAFVGFVVAALPFYLWNEHLAKPVDGGR